MIVKIVVYIAGPFRGKSAWDVENNIRRAEELALECWRAGYAVICPHANTRFFDKAADDSVFLTGDLEIMDRCDVLLTTPDWERSAGALEEVRIALQNDRPKVVHSIEDLKVLYPVRVL